MRIMFDVKCEKCENIVEVFCDRDEIPPCEECGEEQRVALTKQPSIHLVGGSNNGWSDDGRIGTQTGLRRSIPK